MNQDCSVAERAERRRSRRRSKSFLFALDASVRVRAIYLRLDTHQTPCTTSANFSTRLAPVSALSVIKTISRPPVIFYLCGSCMTHLRLRTCGKTQQHKSLQIFRLGLPHRTSPLLQADAIRDLCQLITMYTLEPNLTGIPSFSSATLKATSVLFRLSFLSNP